MLVTNLLWLAPALGTYYLGIIDLLIFCLSLSSCNMVGLHFEGLPIPDILAPLVSGLVTLSRLLREPILRKTSMRPWAFISGIHALHLLASSCHQSVSLFFLLSQSLSFPSISMYCFLDSSVTMSSSKRLYDLFVPPAPPFTSPGPLPFPPTPVPWGMGSDVWERSLRKAYQRLQQQM